MGVESNGMVLAASPDGGKADASSFETPPEPGTRPLASVCRKLCDAISLVMFMTLPCSGYARAVDAAKRVMRGGGRL